MIGGDAVGFHAVAEMISNTPAPVVYLSVSIATGNFTSTAFKTRNDYPVPEPPSDTNILWDDNSDILWDDSTNIEFG